MKEAILLAVLRRDRPLGGCTDAELDLIVRQARAAWLLPRLAEIAGSGEPARAPPEWLGPHLDSAKVAAAANLRSLSWELRQIARALEEVSYPVVLLKGAAYAALGLPNARGRLFGDVDILVPRAALAETEQRLRLHGWASTHLDTYDQRYYREWTHELPPMQHMRRRTVIDVHHSILPVTARWSVDPAKLIEASAPIAGQTPFRAPAPEDLVIHSATHLMTEGEFEKGLRDLVDVAMLIEHFDRDGRFVDSLVARANALGLGRPLYYVLCAAQRKLGAKVTAGSLARLENRPGHLLGAWVTSLTGRALVPHHTTCMRLPDHLAAWLLYLRSHYLKMPWRLLIPHLWHKTFVSPTKSAAQP